MLHLTLFFLSVLESELVNRIRSFIQSFLNTAFRAQNGDSYIFLCAKKL